MGLVCLEASDFVSLCVNNKKLLREEKDLIVTKICANQQQL